MGVNATACAPKRHVIPESDPAAWSESLGSAARAPSATEPLPAQPTTAWRTGLGRAASGPLVLGDRVIVGMGVDRYLSVLEWGTGDRLWRKRLNAPGTSGPIVVHDRIFVATGGPDGRVYAFTLRGKKLWERHLGPVRGPLAAVGGAIVAATEFGGVVALAPDDGTVRWSRRLPTASRAGVVRTGDDLLVCTDDSAYRLRASDGAIETHIGLPGAPVAPPAGQGDTLVIATADGYLTAVTGPDLRVLWTLDVNSPVFGGPAIARDSVFAVTLRGDVWRLPLADASQADAMPVGAVVRAPAAPVRDGVLIGTLGGEILLVRDDSISPQGRAEGPIEQAVIVRDGTMLVVDGRGRVLAWR